MVTNKALNNFFARLHECLQPTRNSNNDKYWVIKEESKESAIREIHFEIKNKDAVIIQQKNGNCPATPKIFKQNGLDDNVPSCDFIVLHCRGNTDEIKICFCEIKSKCSRDHLEKARQQIECSEIFLRYLLENYKKLFDKNLTFLLDNAEHICIYPASITPKNPTTPKHGLKLIKAPIKSRTEKIIQAGDIYEFLKIR